MEAQLVVANGITEFSDLYHKLHPTQVQHRTTPACTSMARKLAVESYMFTSL